MTLEELQSSVSIAAASTQSVEQNDLRDFLNWAEGNLDSIRFTHSDEAAFQAALDVVDRIEIEMRPLLDE